MSKVSAINENEQISVKKKVSSQTSGSVSAAIRQPSWGW